MIAAFWSNVAGSVGTTTNLVCIGSFYAMRFQRRVMLFENHLPVRTGIEQSLFPRKEPELSFVREKPFYYDYHGMEQLLKILRAGYEPEALDRIAVSLLDGYLKYLPLSEQMSSQIYEYELNMVIERLLWELNRQNDLVLIDTQSRDNLSTKTILDRAEMVVVNLRQEPDQIEDFLEHYSGLLEKAVFLLTRYQEESIYNQVNLSRIYKIPQERIWMLPDYPLLSYLQEQGRLPEFLQKNLWATAGEKNFGLIRELRKATGKLYEYEKKGRGMG